MNQFLGKAIDSHTYRLLLSEKGLNVGNFIFWMEDECTLEGSLVGWLGEEVDPTMDYLQRWRVDGTVVLHNY